MNGGVNIGNVYTGNFPAFQQTLQRLQKSASGANQQRPVVHPQQSGAGKSVDRPAKDPYIHETGEASVFKGHGLKADDLERLNAIYSGAVLPDGSDKAGRGYMGLTKNGNQLVPVKFMTHARERHCGFRNNHQLMNEIDNRSTASRNAFDSSGYLEAELLDLADKVSRKDVVAALLSTYKKGAASDRGKSLLSRQVVFKALREIKAGADEYGDKPIAFKFDREIAGADRAALPTSVGGTNWQGKTVPANRADVARAARALTTRNRNDAILERFGKAELKVLAQSFEYENFRVWKEAVTAAKRKLASLDDDDDGKRAELKKAAEAPRPPKVTEKVVKDFLIDVFTVYCKSHRVADMDRQKLLSSLPTAWRNQVLNYGAVGGSLTTLMDVLKEHGVGFRP